MTITVNGNTYLQNADGTYNGQYPLGDKPVIPAAPSGLNVAYLSDTSLSLSWTDNSNNEDNFELDRSPNGVDTWTALTNPPTNATSATDTGLTVDTSYYYRLRAVNGNGGSSYATANGTTTAGSGTEDYPLEIIQPRASLTTDNRFYKQYTGIEYNVRMGVIGGIYEGYAYSLVTAPSGMTIDAATGEITWANPVEAGSPHTVTARVTDGVSTQDVTWTLTVGTTGFKFVDSVSGDDANAGTLAAPWATLNKIGDAASSDFIYFRTGSYATTGHNSWDGSTKPVVLMAYPSETINIDLGLGGYFITNASNRLYIDGLTIDINANATQRGFSFSGTESNITIRRNTFSGLTYTSGNNSSCLFTTNSGTRGQYTVVQDNVSTGGAGYFYLGYSNSHVLVEDNSVSNMTSSAAFSPKSGNNMWFIRRNTTSTVDRSVFIQEFDNSSQGKGPIVVEYNNFESTIDDALLNINGWEQDEQIIVQRNTFRGRLFVRPNSADDGPFHFNKNVIVTDNDTGYTDRIRIGPEGDNGAVFYDDNLSGGTTDGILDANGDLQGSYRTTYLGTHGHEVI